jgi:sialate O-acetylesterase
MRNKSITGVLILVGVIVIQSMTYGDVKLPAVLGDHMVVQQKENVNIWGWAEPNEKVHIKASWQWFFGKSTKADKDGKWKVSIKTPRAGGPYTISIKANNTIKLEDILIGEVWIGSGQSNMEMPLAKVSKAYTGIKDFEKEIASANYPGIRLFQVGNFSSKEPLQDVEPGSAMAGVPPAPCKWQACTPETIPTFSSTAYFFARQFHQKLNVPIGIIDSTWGGSSAEVWTPISGLEKLGLHNELEQAVNSEQNANEKIPARLYNGMIHPLRNFKVKGVIWYQGENNTGRAGKYRDLFSTMIDQWREVFGYTFPFYFVQIAPFDSSPYHNINTAYLREAQLQTMLSVPKTGMVVTMDIGSLTEIHPKNKQEVGRRLALWALANDYGCKDIVYSGPIYREMKIEGNKIRLLFDHIGSGLMAKNGPLTDFIISGENKEFVDATAIIEDDTVVVSSNEVKKPVAVRFAFTKVAMPNLYNKEGLPASPFRTDDWPPE